MPADRRPTTRRIGAAIGVASMLGSLTACGDDNDSADTSAATDPAAATNAAPSTAATAEFKNLGDDEAIATKEYVGAIEGTDIYASFAISRRKDDDAFAGGVAYFCDGKSVANWFRLAPEGDTLRFVATSGATFDAEFGGDDTITGTVELAGKSYSVEANRVDADGEAGLYLADHIIDADLADNERGGWIVLPDGTQRGAIRSGTTILGGPNLIAGSTNVALAGRQIMLKAIAEIIGLDKKS